MHLNVKFRRLMETLAVDSSCTSVSPFTGYIYNNTIKSRTQGVCDSCYITGRYNTVNVLLGLSSMDPASLYKLM